MVRHGDRLETLDLFIGVVGFFSFAFLVVTLICEFTGTDALGWALTLLAFIVVLGCLLLRRRRLVFLARAHAREQESARP